MELKDFDETAYTADVTFNRCNDDGCKTQNCEECGTQGQVETFGPTLERLREKILKEDHHKVWTIFDSPVDDNLHIKAGYDPGLGFMYYVTNEPWEKEDEVYVWCDLEEMHDAELESDSGH